MTVLLAIERSLGRTRAGAHEPQGLQEKWGPRTLDLDILFFGSQMRHQEGLIIPHPHLAERKFVLIPLNEIAPDFVHPVLQKSAEQLLKECHDGGKVTLLA